MLHNLDSVPFAAVIKELSVREPKLIERLPGIMF